MRLQEVTGLNEIGLKSLMLNFVKAEKGAFTFESKNYKVQVSESEISCIYFDRQVSLYDLVNQWEYCYLFFNGTLLGFFEDGK